MTRRASSSSPPPRSSSRSRQPKWQENPIVLLIGAIALIVSFIVTQISGPPNPLPPVPGRDETVTVTAPPPTRTPTRPPVTLTPGTTPIPLVTPITAQDASGLTLLTLPLGSGAQRGFWTVLYTAPSGSRDPATYVGGIDHFVAARIDAVQRTLDIAAYEFNSPALTEAVLRAVARGVTVRVVTDDEAGAHDTESTIPRLIAAGVPVVDDGRRALMHDKFIIFDGQFVLTGSWNLTINDTYRNNNNALLLRSRTLVANYQAEFDEMFVNRQFGPRSPSNTPYPVISQDGITVQTLFAPEDDVIAAIDQLLSTATTSIDFMAFSFTQADMGAIMAERARAGVRVRGIFERTGSETEFSQLRPLFCGERLDVRQDGNPFILHHKVIIIDGTTVLSGSFNFSANATRSNDENLVIIRDPVLAAQYLLEFERQYARAQPPRFTC
ncbi:MAG: phospholipase D-like domain-containing protein [Candidatus Flexifilum sp.]|jgi:phosphatidylserine/phosphatidylglycerophosphate/cardiolipin synthase-like enzyme